MKLYFALVLTILSTLTYAQEKTTIKVIVPHKDDDVYIVGNQTSLGDWNPGKIKMYKIADYVRMVSIPFYFPAEFMFTKGSWESEGIIYELDNNPNIYLEDYVKERVFKIKGWKDEMLEAKIETTYKNEPFESQILSEQRKLKVYTTSDYSLKKRYPVIFMADDGHSFKTAARLLDIWSEVNYKNFPDCILIGIPFTTEELDSFDAQNNQTDLLKDYILYDVIPYVRSKYSTSGFNIIAGKNKEADFIHKLILEDNTPFKAVLSMNPKNSIDYTYRIKKFLKNEENNYFYYFLAQAKFDEPDHAFNIKINELNTKNKINLKTKTYSNYADNLLIESLYDALNFIFKDYRNLERYKDFKEFVFNYERDLMNIYNIPATYQKKDIDHFLNGILDRKDVQMYNYLVDFMEINFIETTETESYKFNAIDKAKHLYQLGLYDDSIERWEDILNNFKSYESDGINPSLFFNQIEFALMAYKKANKPKKIFKFLDICIEKLPDYSLESHYYKAKYSAKYNIQPAYGKSALMHCYKHFSENDYFTQKDLDKIIFD